LVIGVLVIGYSKFIPVFPGALISLTNYSTIAMVGRSTCLALTIATVGGKAGMLRQSSHIHIIFVFNVL
jgi:hypothetical protein